MNPRFTLDGSEALERHLAETCDAVAAAIRSVVPESRLEGVALGGGYGRGEGGVLKTTAGDRPYNDLEFFVFVRGWVLANERRFGRALHASAEHLSTAAGIEVEFKLLSSAMLRRAEPSMFYYDLLNGHRLIIGNEQLFDGCDHHRVAGAIPLHEATRLLMNRCSGLLFARDRLLRPRFTPDDADFVGRNLAKAQLALGDVFLAASGQYHWSVRKRHQRLMRFALDAAPRWLPEVQRHHASGVDFKLHPNQSLGLCARDFEQPFGELVSLASDVWLWLEGNRLETQFGSTAAYALGALDKCPETNGWRNRLVNAKTFGVIGALHSRAQRYPRERLLNSLPLLLWNTHDATRDSGLLKRIQQELGTSAATLTGLIGAYASLWRKFN